MGKCTEKLQDHWQGSYKIGMIIMPQDHDNSTCGDHKTVDSRSTESTNTSFDIPTGIPDLCHAKDGYRQDVVGGKVQEVE